MAKKNTASTASTLSSEVTPDTELKNTETTEVVTSETETTSNDETKETESSTEKTDTEDKSSEVNSENKDSVETDNEEPSPDPNDSETKKDTEIEKPSTDETKEDAIDSQIPEIVIGKENNTEKNKKTLTPIEVNAELYTNYNCKFAMSTASKHLCVNKTMTLYNIYYNFIHNRSAFIGLRKMEDFNHIKEFVENNEFKIDGVVIPAVSKQQFLTRLKSNTDYVVARFK